MTNRNRTALISAAAGPFPQCPISSLRTYRLAGAPLTTQARIVLDFVARSPVKNPYIEPPGCVARTNALDALPGRTAAITLL